MPLRCTLYTNWFYPGKVIGKVHSPYTLQYILPSICQTYRLRCLVPQCNVVTMTILGMCTMVEINIAFTSFERTQHFRDLIEETQNAKAANR
jgi:hypothetical protein